MAISLRSFPFLLTVLWFILALSGCHPSVSAPISMRAVRTTSPTALPLDSDLAAIAHVQSLPLYHQAQTACQRHQYQLAASLLDQLAATPGLNDLELTFCKGQRDLCLTDAGLSVPASQNDTKVLSSFSNECKETSKAQKNQISTSPSLPFSPPTSADCGPRSLLLVCKQLGINVNLEMLRLKAGTTARGTSLQGLAQAAETVGLKTEGVQLSREALSEARMPALAWVNGNHFIAVLALNGSGESGTARIHDPNQSGEETISQERLLRLCSGYLLLLHR